MRSTGAQRPEDTEPIKRRYAEEGAPLDKGKMNRVTIGITVMILLAVFLFLGYPLLDLDRENCPSRGKFLPLTYRIPAKGQSGNAVTAREVTAETVGRGGYERREFYSPHTDLPRSGRRWRCDS